MLGKGLDFSEESIEKSWGKESANESGLKFIPRFDSSFVELVQPRMVIAEPGVRATTRSAAHMGSSSMGSVRSGSGNVQQVRVGKHMYASKGDLIKTLRTDRGVEYYDPIFFQSVGIIHETTAPYTPQQNGVAKRKNRALKEMVNSMLSYSGLSEGFWGEAILTACYLLNRVPNKRNKTTPYELWSCRTVVRLPDPKRKLWVKRVLIASLLDMLNIPRHIVESQRDDHSDDVPSEIPEPRKEEYPRNYDEVMHCWDAAFWKEGIDDKIGSIMENNTWFKARLVIQCFRQKEGIDYFDTYALVSCINTIRLLLALAAIHNLVIHQMDVKTAFLNGDLDEEVYMKQPEGFFMPGNKHKVCKLVKLLYGLKQAPKQWHQKFDEVVLSSGFHLNQSDKCVYSKFDDSGKGVISCLYVDDMLIFDSDQNQVDKTKKFLSSRFLMKDMGKAYKFNREDCSPVSTPMDPVEKLKPNIGYLEFTLSTLAGLGLKPLDVYVVTYTKSLRLLVLRLMFYAVICVDITP
ncbi:zinc finger, CCHC-type containing protein [Tanacetum coccineum]